jgi:hypothetical protein
MKISWLNAFFVLLITVRAATAVEPVSARLQGMGGAGVAMASDVGTVYYNPAGLFFHNNIAIDVSLQSEGMDWPQGWGITYLKYTKGQQGGAGFGIYRIIDNSIPEGGNALASQVTTVYKTPVGVPIGLSLRYINEKWADQKRGNYFAADFGLLIPYRGLLLGVNFQNMLRPDSHLFPYHILVGASWSPAVWLSAAVQVSAADGNQLKYMDQTELRSGLELHPFNLLSLMGGYVKYQDIRYWTAGLGISSSSLNTRFFFAYHWYPEGGGDDRLYFTYNYYL